MSVVDDFKGTSIVVKIAFILLFIASLLAAISFNTTSWAYESNFEAANNHWGIWMLCGNTDQPTGCSPLYGWGATWYGVFQAFVTCGCIGTIVCFVLVILYIFVSKCQKNGEVGIAAGILGIVTGILYLIGIIIFGAKFDDEWNDTTLLDYKLGYSFALSVVAMLLEIIGAILMIVEAKGGGGGGGSKTQASA